MTKKNIADAAYRFSLKGMSTHSWRSKYLLRTSTQRAANFIGAALATFATTSAAISSHHNYVLYAAIGITGASLLLLGRALRKRQRQVWERYNAC
jgi:hypothetical protein